jgi:cell shape-determining protein MreC
MLYWTIQFTIISVILIFLVHHLIHFFKSTLTVPKIKDLVNTPTQKYENMYNIIKQNSPNNTNNLSDYANTNLNDEYTLIDLLPKNDEPTMKTELKNFLKKQINQINNGTDIATLDTMTDTQSYSTY